jgi:hypothetical protein
MMPQALGATIPPFVTAAIVMLLSWRPWRRWRRGGSGSAAVPGAAGAGAPWAVALALGLGAIAGFVAVAGWPGVPPRERWQWLLFINAAATAAGALSAALARRPWARWLALAMTAIAAAGMLQPVGTRAAVAPAWVWKAGAAVLIALAGLAMEPIARRRAGASVPLALAIAFAGASALILQAANATMSLIAAGSAAACGAVVAIAWWNPAVSIARGGELVAAANLMTTLVIAWFYARDASLGAAFVMLAASPLVLWLGELRCITRRRAIVGAILRPALVAVAVATALAMALRPVNEG